MIVFQMFVPRQIFTPDSIYDIARICHANSVCLSVTRMLCVKTAERIIEILSPSDRPIIVVFHHQGIWHKSDGFTQMGAPNTKGGSNFQPICGHISETVIDRGIAGLFDRAHMSIVVCALSNSPAFDDFE